MEYTKVSQYYQEITEFILDIIQNYVQMTVSIKNERIEKIKDIAIFPKDLFYLKENTYTEEEIRIYEQKMKEYEQWYQTISLKCENAAKNKVIIPLEYLFRIWKLTKIERFCVLFSLAAELDYRFERIYVQLQDDCQKKLPTLDFCIRLFTFRLERRKEILIDLLSSEGKLKYFFEYFEKSEDYTGNITKQLKLSKRIYDYIFHIESKNEALTAAVKFYFTWDRLEPLLFQKEYQQKVNNIINNAFFPICLYLWGTKGSGKRLQIKHWCKSKKKSTAIIKLRKFPETMPEFFEMIRELQRELMIQNAVPCIELTEKEHPYFNEFIQNLKNYCPVIFLVSEKEWKSEKPEYISFFSIQIAAINWEERVKIWEAIGKGNLSEEEISYKELAERFNFSPGLIKKTVEEAKQIAVWEEKSKITKEICIRAAQKQIFHKLYERAVRINTLYEWEDLILPNTQKQLLQKACDQVKYQYQIYNMWGFKNKVTYGNGISLLFLGSPGTGKTMAAQVMAKQLEMEIYKVDLSQVMSKYIGETEKNLGIIFEEVKNTNSILFFDEADALFGKRSEVKDSHDKYANAQTAYLLQKVEEYDGVVILATNYIQNFDEAYKRRIKFIIDFPFPNAEQRYLIWKSVYPKEAPLEEIDYQFLSEKFEVTGSNIKNIAVASAFLAVKENKKIGMKHIMEALEEEIRKSGVILQKEQLEEYAY